MFKLLTIIFLGSINIAQAENVSQALQNRMDYLVQRQGITASNIANATTPGYLTRDIKFAPVKSGGNMKIARTNAQHLAMGERSNNFKVVTSNKHVRHDGNSVKLDEEMLKLQDIQMNYRMMTRIKSKLGAIQKMAISRNNR